MSGQIGGLPPPQPPRVLGAPQRKKGGRRLGALPYTIAGGVTAVCVGVIFYAISSSQHAKLQQAAAAGTPSASGTPPDPNIILAGMPSSGAIAAANQRRRAQAAQQRPATAAPDRPATTPAAPPQAPPTDEVR